MVMLLPDVSPPPAGALPPLWLCAPPWLPHAASANEVTATAATTRSVLREPSIFTDHSSLLAAGREADCTFWETCCRATACCHQAVARVAAREAFTRALSSSPGG